MNEPYYLPIHLKGSKDPVFLDFEGAFSLMKPRDAEMVRLRFGLSGYCPTTFKGIAEIYNISNSRVHQIMDRALRTLRHPRMREFIWRC